MRQDDVIVPDLGGFVARRIPARLSDDGRRIMPPYKQLLFHANLNLSDGVFERYVAHRSKTTMQEATSTIANAVSLWNQQLKNGERIELDKVGYLFTDKDNKVRFEQDRSYNLLLQAYGLSEILFEKKIEEKNQISTISLPPQEKEMEGLEITSETFQSTEFIAAETENNTKIVLVQDAVGAGKNTRSIWLKVAAAAVLLPFTFYSFWVPMTTDVLETKKLAFSDFNPFHKHTSPHYQKNILNWEVHAVETNNDLDQIVAALPDDALFYNFNYDDDFILPVRIETNPSAQVTETTILSAAKHQDQAYSGKKIHLISGCFSQKQNAENHIQALKEQGFDAYIVDIQGGLHRVAVLGIDNESELSVASNKLKEKEISFWTLKK